MAHQIYNQKIALTILILNGISALSLIIVMCIYISGWKKINNYPMRLIFYLCIACLLQNIYVFLMTPADVNQDSIIHYNSQNILCDIEAAVKTGSDLSSIIWTSFIIYSAYASIIHQEKVQKYELTFLLCGFLVPFIIGIIPIAFQLYGFSGYYCWFQTKDDTLQFALKMVFYYLPLWILFGINMFLSFKTYNNLKSLNIAPKQLRFFKRLLFFPFILFVCGFFSTIHKIQQLATDYREIFWLSILDYSLFSLYGFFNALAYGLNPTIRNHIKQLLCKSDQIRRNQRASTNTQKLNKQIFLEQFN